MAETEQFATFGEAFAAATPMGRSPRRERARGDLADAWAVRERAREALARWNDPRAIKLREDQLAAMAGEDRDFLKEHYHIQEHLLRKILGEDGDGEKESRPGA